MKAEELTETWDTIDPAKWWNAGTAYVQDGALVCPRDNDAWAGSVFTSIRFDMTNSFVFSELRSHSTGPLYTDSYFQVNDGAGGSAQRSMSIDVENAQISIYRSNGDGGWTTFAGFPRDPVAHRWLGWFHDGTRMIVKTSPDGRTWTELWATPAGDANFDLTNCVLSIGAGGEPTGDPSIWGDVNIAAGRAVPIPNGKRTKAVVLENGRHDGVLLPSYEDIEYTTRFDTDDGRWQYRGGANVSGGLLQIPLWDDYRADAHLRMPNNVDWAHEKDGLIFSFELVHAAPGETFSYLTSSPYAGISFFFDIFPQDNSLRPGFDYNGRDQTFLTYDPIAHRWLRHRFEGGWHFWDASPDGKVWTALRSVALPVAYPMTDLGIGTGFAGADGSLSTLVDNVTLSRKVGSGPATAELLSSGYQAIITRGA